MRKHFVFRFLPQMSVLADIFYNASRCSFLMQKYDINDQLTTVALSCDRALVHGPASCTIACNSCQFWCSFPCVTLSLNVPHKVAQFLPPDLCSGSLQTIKFYHGPIDGPFSEALQPDTSTRCQLKAFTERTMLPNP